MLKLSTEEIKTLLDYFYNYAGYISHEFNPGVHKIIKRMATKLDNEERIKDDPSNIQTKRD